MQLITIVSLTLRELSRRRVLAAALILTGLALALNAWGLHHLEATFLARGKDGVLASRLTFSFVIVLLAYAFSFVLAIASAFLGAPALSSDVESGLLLAILPRPLSRLEFAFGRWFGLAIPVILYAIVAAACEFAIVDVIAGYVPPHPALAVLFLAWEAVALLTLAFLFSTRLPPIAGGVCAVAAFGFAWICGIVGSIATAVGNEALLHATTVVRLVIPTDGIWRAALAQLQPVAVASVADAAGVTNPFASDGPPQPIFLAWCVAWTLAILAIAIANFRRRDL